MPASVNVSLVERQHEGYSEVGMASYYGDGDGFEDLVTASGEVLKSELATCAHRTLPFNTLLQVTNLRNGRSVLARVNDRGPFVKGRIVDVSTSVAHGLGLRGKGIARVSIRVVVPEGMQAARQAGQGLPMEEMGVVAPKTEFAGWSEDFGRRIDLSDLGGQVVSGMGHFQGFPLPPRKRPVCHHEPYLHREPYVW